MNQYCRYCSHLFCGDYIICDIREISIKETTAKSPNHCKDFEFNEMDAFGELGKDGKYLTYRPRQAHTPDYVEINQIRMED